MQLSPPPPPLTLCRHVVSMFELYQAPKCLWIVLELVDGGDLHKHLRNADHYSERMAARHMRQILDGVHYLHSLGIVHRDLKLDNILLTGSTAGSPTDVKIADFGLSALVRVGELGYDPFESCKRKGYRALSDMWGTKEMFAPELIDQVRTFHTVHGRKAMCFSNRYREQINANVVPGVWPAGGHVERGVHVVRDAEWTPGLPSARPRHRELLLRTH